MNIKHSVTGVFTPHSRFLPPEVYSLVRDNVVRACVDVIIMDKRNKKVLLGKRIIEPWPNWWTFGGRIIPGESPSEACARTVEQDLGLSAIPQEFVFIEPISLVFSRRNEPPQENGCHDLSNFHLLLVNKVPLDHLEKKEYREVRWFSVEEVVAPNFHHALAYIVKIALLRIKPLAS